MLAIIGASGKIGGATLDALLSYQLIPKDQLVCLTSSHEGDSKWQQLASKGVAVRHGTFDDAVSLRTALRGCDRFFLVSSPRIEMDFFDAPWGQGREKDHFAALEAANEAGVKHIYYTSLAFANPSKSRVMTAHERTEKYLQEHWTGDGRGWTIIREGLYNESWPLYFGHYDVPDDSRSEIPVAGDGPLSWTAIADLGLATAIVLSEAIEKHSGQTFYLSNTHDPKTLRDIATIVSQVRGREVRLKLLAREEHEKYYIQERGLDEGMIKWWARTYDALKDDEAYIKDGTLERLLESQGRKPKPLEQTIREMLQA